MPSASSFCRLNSNISQRPEAQRNGIGTIFVLRTKRWRIEMCEQYGARSKVKQKRTHTHSPSITMELYEQQQQQQQNSDFNTPTDKCSNNKKNCVCSLTQFHHLKEGKKLKIEKHEICVLRLLCLICFG